MSLRKMTLLTLKGWFSVIIANKGLKPPGECLLTADLGHRVSAGPHPAERRLASCCGSATLGASQPVRRHSPAARAVPGRPGMGALWFLAAAQ